MRFSFQRENADEAIREAEGEASPPPIEIVEARTKPASPKPDEPDLLTCSKCGTAAREDEFETRMDRGKRRQRKVCVVCARKRNREQSARSRAKKKERLRSGS